MQTPSDTREVTLQNNRFGKRWSEALFGRHCSSSRPVRQTLENRSVVLAGSSRWLSRYRSRTVLSSTERHCRTAMEVSRVLGSRLLVFSRVL